MTATTFADDLLRYGPHALRGDRVREPTLDEASAYCRSLARRHYENFTVASWLLPRHLRTHFCHIYAYCRWSDDLADELDSTEQSRQLLAWWEGQLDDCLAGRARHPVFVALRATIDQFAIPRRPLADLLIAFRQDQERTRYRDWPQLEDYCRYSANPVGELVLYLGRCHAPENVAMSDSICTGLQLANFCQDVCRDFARGRIYLPQDEWVQFGVDEALFGQRQAHDALRALLAFQVDRAERLLETGWPLVDHVPKELRIDVSLFVQGGLAILAAIRRARHDVWSSRPTVSRLAKMAIFARAWLRGGRR